MVFSLVVIWPLRFPGNGPGHTGGHRPVPGQRNDAPDALVRVYVMAGTMPGQVPPVPLQPPPIMLVRVSMRTYMHIPRHGSRGKPNEMSRPRSR